MQKTENTGFYRDTNNPRESKRNGQVTTTIVANGLYEILNNIAKHGKPGAFAFILSVGPDAVRIFASNLYNAAINSAPENHYGTALIQDFAQQHNGTMTINSENEEWSLSLTIPLAHQVKLMFSPTEKL